MKDTAKVDVVLSTLNSENTLRQCLSAAQKVLPVNRFIIVDGGSVDGTLEIAREFGCIIHVRPDLNLGQSRLFGFQQVETEWFVQLDSDVVLHETWFEEVTKHAEQADIIETGRINYYKIPFVPTPRRGLFGQCLIKKSTVENVESLNIGEQEDEFFRGIVTGKGYVWLQLPECLADHYGPYYATPERYKNKNMKMQVSASISGQEPTWKNNGYLDGRFKGIGRLSKTTLYLIYKPLRDCVHDLLYNLKCLFYYYKGYIQGSRHK
jgi:glycosyltransferase involved in cell wall biosynthesis